MVWRWPGALENPVTRHQEHFFLFFVDRGAAELSVEVVSGFGVAEAGGSDGTVDGVDGETLVAGCSEQPRRGGGGDRLASAGSPSSCEFAAVYDPWDIGAEQLGRANALFEFLAEVADGVLLRGGAGEGAYIFQVALHF